MVVDLLPVEAFESWGWRVPFLLGGLVAVVGMLLRRQLHSDVPPAEKTSPLRDTFGLHRMDVLRVILLNIGPGVTFYAAFVYAVSYMKTIDKLPAGIAFNNNTEAMAVILVCSHSAQPRPCSRAMRPEAMTPTRYLAGMVGSPFNAPECLASGVSAEMGFGRLWVYIR